MMRVWCCSTTSTVIRKRFLTTAGTEMRIPSTSRSFTSAIAATSTKHRSASFVPSPLARLGRTSMMTELRRKYSATKLSSDISNVDVSAGTLLHEYTNQVGQDVGTAMLHIIDADAICFDVDSTVITEEGIDVLADYLHKGDEVAALTLQAMEGGMKFQEALKRRLECLEPSKASIEACLAERPFVLTPRMDELVSLLHQKQKAVFLVSGGFRIMIEPIAKKLKIPVRNIYANTITFDSDGAYTGFDDTEPTSRDMGKSKAVQLIQESTGYTKLVMVGDGATDLQAKPPATTIVGYGGVAEREKVFLNADWFVKNWDVFIDIIEFHCHTWNLPGDDDLVIPVPNEDQLKEMHGYNPKTNQKR